MVDPSSDLIKIQALRHELHDRLVPQVLNFAQSPPIDKEERAKQLSRLRNMMIQKILEPARAIRPERVDKVEVERIKMYLYGVVEAALEKLDLAMKLDPVKTRQ